MTFQQVGRRSENTKPPAKIRRPVVSGHDNWPPAYADHHQRLEIRIGFMPCVFIRQTMISDQAGVKHFDQTIIRPVEKPRNVAVYGNADRTEDRLRDRDECRGCRR